MSEITHEQIIVELMSNDFDVKIYRPEYNNFTGSMEATIVLCQTLHWAKKSKNYFYKFKQRPKQKKDGTYHQKYKEGDSWCEELNIGKRTFENAMDSLKQKGIVQSHTDRERLTWYSVDYNVLVDCVKSICGHSEDIVSGMLNPQKGFSKIPKRDLPIYTKNTTNIYSKSFNHKVKKNLSDKDIIKLYKEYKDELKNSYLTLLDEKEKENINPSPSEPPVPLPNLPKPIEDILVMYVDWFFNFKKSPSRNLRTFRDNFNRLVECLKISNVELVTLMLLDAQNGSWQGIKPTYMTKYLNDFKKSPQSASNPLDSTAIARQEQATRAAQAHIDAGGDVGDLF